MTAAVDTRMVEFRYSDLTGAYRNVLSREPFLNDVMAECERRWPESRLSYWVNAAHWYNTKNSREVNNCYSASARI